MKQIILILILIKVMAVTGCELIQIGSPAARVNPYIVDIDQKTSLGAVYLFKAEIDSAYIPGATQVLADPDGERYLPVRKVELWDEVSRIGRIIRNRGITLINIDTLNASHHVIDIEFDYIRNMSFRTSLIDGNWYITEYILDPRDQ